MVWVPFNIIGSYAFCISSRVHFRSKLHHAGSGCGGAHTSRKGMAKSQRGGPHTTQTYPHAANQINNKSSYQKIN